MSYVITDGKRYCHRTKTRAVEIVNDLDSATRFANKDMAQNILQRATKKLSGFSLMELPAVSARETPVKTKARGSEEKQRGKKTPAKETQAKEMPVKETPDQTVLSLKQTDEPAAEKPAQSVESEEKAGRSESRKKTHRGGRRRKNSSQESASSEQAAKAGGNEADASETKTADAEAEPVKTEAETEKTEAKTTAAVDQAEKADKAAAPEAKASPAPMLPPSFRMEIRGGASNQKPSPKKELPEAAAAPAAADASDSAAAPAEETTASEQNRSRKAGRSRRGGRKNRADANQPSAAVQEVPKQEADQTVTSPREEQPKAESQAADQVGAAAAPEKPAAPAAPVIPMFTVQTHHVSENAVARPVRAEQTAKESDHADQKQPSAAAVSEQTAQGTDDRTLVIETAHVTDAPKSGQGTDGGRDSGRTKTTGRSRGSRGGRSREEQGRESSAVRESAEKKPASEAEAKSGENSRSRAKGRSKSVSSTESKRRIFTTQERYEIYNRTEGHCGICGKFIPLGEYTIDHIIPLSKGGTNDLDNLQACCSFCNKAKDDSIGDEFFQRIQNIFLYQAQLKFGKKKLKKLKKVMDEIEE